MSTEMGGAAPEPEAEPQNLPPEGEPEPVLSNGTSSPVGVIVGISVGALGLLGGVAAWFVLWRRGCRADAAPAAAVKCGAETARVTAGAGLERGGTTESHQAGCEAAAAVSEGGEGGVPATTCRAYDVQVEVKQDGVIHRY